MFKARQTREPLVGKAPVLHDLWRSSQLSHSDPAANLLDRRNQHLTGPRTSRLSQTARNIATFDQQRRRTAHPGRYSLRVAPHDYEGNCGIFVDLANSIDKHGDVRTIGDLKDRVVHG